MIIQTVAHGTHGQFYPDAKQTSVLGAPIRIRLYDMELRRVGMVGMEQISRD